MERRRLLSDVDISSFERWTSQPMAALALSVTRVASPVPQPEPSQVSETKESGGCSHAITHKARQKKAGAAVGSGDCGHRGRWQAARAGSRNNRTQFQFENFRHTPKCG